VQLRELLVKLNGTHRFGLANDRRDELRMFAIIEATARIVS